jgi:hypothetical protein
MFSSSLLEFEESFLNQSHTGRVDLTFAPHQPRPRKAKFKSKTALETYICRWSFDSNIRKDDCCNGMRVVPGTINPLTIIGFVVIGAGQQSFIRRLANIRGGLRLFRSLGRACRAEALEPARRANVGKADADVLPAISSWKSVPIPGLKIHESPA